MPPETTASATAVVTEILRLRAPLSLPVLRAALKGKRVQLDPAELAALLEDGAFVEGPEGHWSLAPAASDASSAAPGPAAGRVPAERFTRERLASRCGVPVGVLEEVLGELAGDSSGVDWAALRARLAAGAEVAVSARTLGLLDEGVRRHEVARLRAEAEAKQAAAESRRRLQQMAEDEVAMLRAELDGERRRAQSAVVERDRLVAQASSVVVRQQPEPPAWQATDAGGWLLDLGAPETFGEERLRQALGQVESAVSVLNVSIGQVELEAVVVHPGGVAVIEQYDLPATAGVVTVPAAGPASVGDTPLEYDPRGQVMAAVRALQRRASLDLAYLPVVAFQGPADVSAEDVLACLTSELDLAVEDALADRTPVSREQVVALLSKLEVPDLPEVPAGF